MIVWTEGFVRLTNDRSIKEDTMEFVAKHNRVALASAKAYATSKPWQGTFTERVEKIRTLHAEMTAAYGVDVGLIIDTEGGEPIEAGGYVSFLSPNEDGTIVLHPGFAVTTYFRLFAEALEYTRDLTNVKSDEEVADYAARWSNGLFKKAFPASWDALVDRDAPILTRDYA